PGSASCVEAATPCAASQPATYSANAASPGSSALTGRPRGLTLGIRTSSDSNCTSSATRPAPFRPQSGANVTRIRIAGPGPTLSGVNPANSGMSGKYGKTLGSWTVAAIVLALAGCATTRGHGHAIPRPSHIRTELLAQAKPRPSCPNAPAPPPVHSGQKRL